MEIIVLVGIPGSGKTTLARTRFPNHSRINLDTLRSRNKEDAEIRTCIMNGKDIIIDNTNTTIKARKKYVEIAKLFGYSIRAIVFQIPIELALERNASRKGKERVPEPVLKMYHRMLQRPTEQEGFDRVEVITEFLMPN
jgi:predicted kinase